MKVLQGFSSLATETAAMNARGGTEPSGTFAEIVPKVSLVDEDFPQTIDEALQKTHEKQKAGQKKLPWKQLADDTTC